MTNPVGRAGTAVVSPLLKSNDSAAADSNLAQVYSLIASATRLRAPLTIQLPMGRFFVGDGTQAIFALNESHSGLTIQGMGVGKTILVPAADVSASPLTFLSTRVSYSSPGTLNPSLATITNIPAAEIAGYLRDDVVYIWAFTSGNSRPVSYRRIVDNVGTDSVDLNASFPSFSGALFKHVKGVALSGQIPANSNTVTLLDSDLASRLTVGGDVLIGDGPALNNFYSEWARVESISGTTVTLDRRLRRTYAPTGSGRDACIVPGPHMSDITIRDLTIVVPESEITTLQLATIRFGLRVRFENVEFAPLVTGSILYRAFEVVNCGETSVENVTGNGQLSFMASQDSGAQNSVVASIGGSEYCSDLTFDGIITYRPEGFSFASASGPGPCERINLVNSRITGYGNSSTANVVFVKGSSIDNVQILLPGTTGTPPAIVLEDGQLNLTSITSDSAITVQGVELRIANLTAPGLTLANGSSGFLVTPLLPASATLTDNSNFAWRIPLPMRTDRKVVSPSAGVVTLQVMAVPFQSVDLQQWQDFNGNKLFAIRSDGNLASANIQAQAQSELRIGSRWRHRPADGRSRRSVGRQRAGGGDGHLSIAGRTGSGDAGAGATRRLLKKPNVGSQKERALGRSTASHRAAPRPLWASFAAAVKHDS